jgi:hypothetical protein
MSIATISHMPDAPTPEQQAVFEFEHMMAHRNFFIAMSPLYRFNILPYLLDPFEPPLPDVRSGQSWNLDHQQAHNDMLSDLPRYYGGWEDLPPELGLSIGQILRDTDFDNPEQVTWWTFANHREHYIANETTFPEETAPTYWKYPFW